MGIGKQIRMQRLFAHPSGRLCSVAVDHLVGYGVGMHPGLRHIKQTLQAVVAAHPDAVTLHKGMIMNAWAPYAGQIPVIVQSTVAQVDNDYPGQLVTPEEAVRIGAEAIAISRFMRGPKETEYLEGVAAMVRDAERFDLPVIIHVYPRKLEGTPTVSYEPEDIAWVVRCAAEMGVDIVKTPYCGDVVAHAQIVADCPVPVVAAGGPRAKTLEAALQMMGDAVRAGVKGATIGRNIWGADNITATARAFQYVIHDGKSAQEALKLAGL